MSIQLDENWESVKIADLFNYAQAEIMPEAELNRVVDAWFDNGAVGYRTLAKQLGGIGLGTVERIIK